MKDNALRKSSPMISSVREVSPEIELDKPVRQDDRGPQKHFENGGHQVSINVERIEDILPLVNHLKSNNKIEINQQRALDKSEDPLPTFNIPVKD